jgi:hypothetical protein
VCAELGYSLLGAGDREEAEGRAAEGAGGGGLEPSSHAASTCDMIAGEEVGRHACFLLFVLVVLVVFLVLVRFECI